MAFSLDIEGRLRRRWPFGARVFRALQRVDVGFMANSVAFQAFAALLPLLVVLFVIVAFLAGDALADRVLALTQSFLPEEARRLLANAVTTELRTTSTSVVSVAILLWGALNLFKGLDSAFSIIYATEAQNSLVEQTRDALVVFGVLLLAILGAIVAGSVPFLTRIPFLGVLTPLLLLVGLVVVFLPMYYEFPDTEITVRQALPGAVVAAAGWTALQLLFGLYVSVTSGGGTGGAIGAVLLLLTWLYFGSMLLLLGAVVNAVIAGVRPKPARSGGAVPTPE